MLHCIAFPATARTISCISEEWLFEFRTALRRDLLVTLAFAHTQRETRRSEAFFFSFPFVVSFAVGMSRYLLHGRFETTWNDGRRGSTKKRLGIVGLT